MNIGEAAARTSLPAKTIRYYEEIGLIRAARTSNGYRDFGDQEVHKLAFLRARALGFSIEVCRALLRLYEDDTRASAEVKALAGDHLGEIDTKIRDLQEMRDTLADLVTACAGDARPDCPILASLADEPENRALKKSEISDF